MYTNRLRSKVRSGTINDSFDQFNTISLKPGLTETKSCSVCVSPDKRHEYSRKSCQGGYTETLDLCKRGSQFSSAMGSYNKIPGTLLFTSRTASHDICRVMKTSVRYIKQDLTSWCRRISNLPAVNIFGQPMRF